MKGGRGLRASLTRLDRVLGARRGGRHGRGMPENRLSLRALMSSSGLLDLVHRGPPGQRGALLLLRSPTAPERLRGLAPIAGTDQTDALGTRNGGGRRLGGTRPSGRLGCARAGSGRRRAWRWPRAW